MCGLRNRVRQLEMVRTWRPSASMLRRPWMSVLLLHLVLALHIYHIRSVTRTRAFLAPFSQTELSCSRCTGLRATYLKMFIWIDAKDDDKQRYYLTEKESCQTLGPYFACTRSRG